MEFTQEEISVYLNPEKYFKYSKQLSNSLQWIKKPCGPLRNNAVDDFANWEVVGTKTILLIPFNDTF